MQSGSACEVEGDDQPAPLQGVRVLLADDSAASRGLLALHLQRAGAAVTTVDDGHELLLAMTDGVDATASLRDPVAFDLVLTDVEMPGLDGHAATRLLRSLGCTLPVVALTGHASDEDVARSRRAGCSAHVGKPVDPQQLFHTCAALLNGAEAGAGDASPAPAEVGQEQAPAELRSTFADDPDMLELVTSFTGTLTARAETMQALHREGSLAQLARIAHQLKGVGSGYGFPPITEAARAVDSQARTGTASPALANSLAQLVALCRAAAATHADDDAETTA